MKFDIKKTWIISFLTIILLIFSINSSAATEFENGIQEITNNLITGLNDNKEISENYHIAVADFITKNDETTELSKYIAENIIISLINKDQNKIKVLERQRLNSVLEEHNLLTQGVLKKDASKKIGELLGASSIIIGKYYNIGQQIHIIAKIVSVKTGYIYAATSKTINKNTIIFSLLEEDYLSNMTTIDMESYSLKDEENEKKNQNTKTSPNC